jgi:hypothetical protein
VPDNRKAGRLAVLNGVSSFFMKLLNQDEASEFPFPGKLRKNPR